MQIIHPPVVKGNSYPIYFHIHCGESSKRHWGKYDNIHPLSQPLSQVLDSNWSSRVCHTLGGGTVHSHLCAYVLLVVATVRDAMAGREGMGKIYCLCGACCFASFMLAGPHRKYVAPLFRSAPPEPIIHLVPSPSLRIWLMLGLMLLALPFLVGANCAMGHIVCVCRPALFMGSPTALGAP